MSDATVLIFESVAGVHTLAFVERITAILTRIRTGTVSPGFTPRPSLSEHERRALSEKRGRVSPGFTPRPSLSERQSPQPRPRRHVSPGFTPRPSLSERQSPQPRPSPACVAGVHTSAFVERIRFPSRRRRGPSGVAGVHTSAFVERPHAMSADSPTWMCRRGSHLGLR